MWAAWRAITATADAYLDTLTPEMMSTHLEREGKPMREDVGISLLRNSTTTGSTWERRTLRQMLGHTNLPQYVGDMAAVRYALEEQD